MSDTDVSTVGLGDKNPAPDAVIAAATGEEPRAPIDPEGFLGSVAEEMGWTPKEKWKGDPDKWRPAEEFLRNTPKVVKSLKEQIDRSNRVATQQIERARAQAVEDAERRIAEAAEAGDREAAAQATEDLKRANAAPDPQVADFYARHSWMTPQNPAYSVALAAAQKVADSGGTVQAQLEAAEKEVRKRFPEEFGEDDPPPRKQAPAVEGGQRAATSRAPAKRGWSDLPATIRQSITPKQLKVWGLSQEEYADAWHKENV